MDIGKPIATIMMRMMILKEMLHGMMFIYDYTDRVYFDPEKNAWFVPEDMIKKHEIKEEGQ